MSLSFRQSDILDIASIEGRVTVEGLAERFGVTVQTIRRDLTELADAGKLDRVHGGAVLRSGVSNIGYDDRRALNADAKTRIAQTCASDIPDGASIFMNIGTSTEAVARQLLSHKNLMVVTNNMNVANILIENPDCEIVVAGGVLRRSDGGLIGNLTVSTIQQFKFDLAVIGCSALDRDGDLLDFDFQEVQVSQTIIAQARRTFLVADHSKFQRSAPARITSMSEIDRIYTDVHLPGDLPQHCREWQTEVVLCAQ
ncbi:MULTISPECIES: DeoR/GlpR family DNA-binding transcription regulator [unclassified Ruegeria]|uniref:DeoR/GlpR family DNA-binding transcription regulator n=1 Tax=unclassified Ruegeria TaxID=2625375 RepID=UPI001487871C|nr:MULTISPECIES: DeoR/GlpR family DNA-binding transcription regulator [unclassified Ruegeria]NOD33704.1 DeoR family transcriptional regulator [Ruegeria sp. HKCCD7296]NOE33105.1 DeoR family transcriptional regulator [Ruegeria sp. HKCCD7318]NOE40621.1 DeoR family transcriptional regulator [Ruegeria sp. HKCCD7319]